jgi:hypothetical protein
MALQDDISQYIPHFRAQNREIEEIASTRPISREILYFVEIDTLSRAAFPQVSGNRKRVVQFIDTCSHWALSNQRTSMLGPGLQIVNCILLDA